jgi:hypothetical protein
MEGSDNGRILRYYPEICLEGLRKTMKKLSQYHLPPGRDLNQGPPEYEAGELTTQLQRSVFIIINRIVTVTITVINIILLLLCCACYGSFGF